MYKPAGVLVQGDSSGDKSLMDDVKKYLKDKYKKPGNVFLGLVHRLDRPVSGIVLFAKTSKGASRLSEQFRNNEINKTYHALVEGELGSKKGKLIHFLEKDQDKKIALVKNSPDKNYDKSELECQVLKSNGKNTLVKIKLITGRFHQIRAQFSTIGHPVVGDVKYGARNKLPDGSIALCATEIKFKTATTNELKTIKINYSPNWSILK